MGAASAICISYLARLESLAHEEDISFQKYSSYEAIENIETIFLHFQTNFFQNVKTMENFEISTFCSDLQ